MTEKDKIPDQWCGFKLKANDEEPVIEVSPESWRERVGGIVCSRETWRDTDRCIWHAEVENKPVEELKAARADGLERLDGAYLAGIDAGDDLSFQGCGLRSAVFHDAHFITAEFHDADLNSAQFHNAHLTCGEFSDADLTSAEFHDAYLTQAQFHNADLIASLFHSAILIEAQFHDANLNSAHFHDAYLFRTDFHNARLVRAEFPDAYLNSAQFRDADLTDTDYDDADVRNTDFTHATLHNTLLTRADCRGATFINAFLYETVFANTRINSQTTFYDSNRSRPVVVYEERPHTSEDLPENVHPLEAAEWVYRRLEKLHEENALSEDARDFHISKEEARRKYQRESGEYARYAVSTLQWYVTGHGESIPRIFRSAAVLILGCGILYPFAGGFESSSTGAAYRIHLPPTEFSRAVILDGIATFLQSIYFSVITFTTIGYGDLYPTGAWSKVLVGFESLSGAILIALFVFVLGRRVAR